MFSIISTLEEVVVIANQAHPIKYHSSGLKMGFACFATSSYHLLFSSAVYLYLMVQFEIKTISLLFLIQSMSFLLLTLSYFISCYCCIFLFYCLWSKMTFMLKNVVILLMSKVHIKHLFNSWPIFFIKINLNVALWLLKLSCMKVLKLLYFSLDVLLLSTVLCCL